MTLNSPNIQIKLSEWQQELRDLMGDDKVIISAYRPVPVMIQLERLAQIVCEETGIDLPIVRSKSRKVKVVMARHLISYYGRMATGLPLKEIGRYIGNVDHTTIIHGNKHIKDLLDIDDPEAVELVTRINKRLEQNQVEA